MGFEANFAGTSFLAPPEQMLNKFRYGPAFMTVLGNRTEPGGCATCGWDDEGVPAQSWPIVSKGIFVELPDDARHGAAGFRTSRRPAASHGTALGQNWKSIPFQRMPNVSLQPNPRELTEDDVIGETKRGIYIEGDGSFSIDQQRYNFQFGGQTFWEIKDGKRTRMLRDVAYQARTPDFWNSLALVGGQAHLPARRGAERRQGSAAAGERRVARLPDRALPQRQRHQHGVTMQARTGHTPRALGGRVASALPQGARLRDRGPHAREHRVRIERLHARGDQSHHHGRRNDGRHGPA